MVTPELLSRYQRDGYVVVPQLFSAEEVAALRDHFMHLRLTGTYPRDWAGANPKSDDPLKKYMRMIHMHHWDDTARTWLLDDRIRQCLLALLGSEPYAVQTMLYFKPAGARGQALHQDQYYLRVQPGTCMAAWLALDPCDEENGCMQVVPATQDLPLLCTTRADLSQSISAITVPLAKGMRSVPIIMDAGDVLFFNGSTIHGSLPNVSRTRFRRAIVGHYIQAEAEIIAKGYDPILRMDGSVVEVSPTARGGGECGVWMDDDDDDESTLVFQPEGPDLERIPVMD
jgi:phytanoyl-CoA hydroxylase